MDIFLIVACIAAFAVWFVKSGTVDILFYKITQNDNLKHRRIYFDYCSEAREKYNSLQKYFFDNDDKLTLLKMKLHTGYELFSGDIEVYIDMWYATEKPDFKPDFTQFERK